VRGAGLRARLPVEAQVALVDGDLEDDLPGFRFQSSRSSSWIVCPHRAEKAARRRCFVSSPGQTSIGRNVMLAG
jgi:hypothetical protein